MLNTQKQYQQKDLYMSFVNNEHLYKLKKRGLLTNKPARNIKINI